MGKRFTAKDADWDGIEREYRAGQRSNVAIANDYGVSETAIRKKAKREGWIKGEPYAVRALARKKADAASIPAAKELPEDQLDAIAEVGSQVLIKHRTMAANLQALVVDLAEQLKSATHTLPELESAIVEYYNIKAANNPLAAAQYRQQCSLALRALGLGSRSKTLVNLTNAIDKLVSIERKAYNLDDDGDRRTYEELLAEIEAKSKQAA